MSKTIEEIKEQVAKEYTSGKSGWHGNYLSERIKLVLMNEVAKRFAQSQTQELIKQNMELVDLVERCRDVIYAYNDYRPTATGNEILQAIQDRLTKYNHLKSNTNETDKI